MPFTATIDGDHEKGWIGEVHDGETHTVHRPIGESLRMALSHMLHLHFGDNPAAEPKEPDGEAEVAKDGLPVPPRGEGGKFVKSDPEQIG